MSSVTKECKNKFIPDDIEDFITFEPKLSPKCKKTLKRRKLVDEMDQDIRGKDVNNKKGKKSNRITNDSQICSEYKQKILNNMNEQLNSGNQMNETMQKKVSEFITDLERDYSVLKNNVKELEEFTTATMNCLHQTTTAIKQKIDILKEMEQTYKKQCKATEERHQLEINQLEEDLNREVEKVKEKLASETKKTYLDMFQRSFIQAMKNNN
ncbi:chromosome partition protein Smc-like [Pieris napi]|uniref:chromosome partition protein Smc-like n=1 Tax=Pieris napi TaxID=78633 RepID=UPI001FBBF68A|nr:chromosome partition protein Smc-like [Pieris napi]